MLNSLTSRLPVLRDHVYAGKNGVQEARRILTSVSL